MNTMEESLRKFEETANRYLLELNGFELEQLRLQPSENEWSLGQMYLHLINSALYMQLRNIDNCLTQEEDSAGSLPEKTKEGQAIMERGQFPPIRIQVPPSPQYTPGQPESKEQLIEGLHTVIARMKEIMPKLEQAPVRNSMPHPRFGALNAQEWFLLIEMHYRHHLMQMDRLKQFIAGSA
ncbi:DinB family protein [Paenibacillus sp. J5C_2022]|uniref:DinB family protein n=1 Tax=Paenibacillus sp. J5C2022 TaxID=2977129 RepID=UPI0021CF72B7|nr:DinB family protein [Paenibacillus sp. J5C2022]MCU6711905.1 DinB family protein [Paenibacillus sp. J5C2022]